MKIKVGDIIKVVHLDKSKLNTGYALPAINFEFKINETFEILEIYNIYNDLGMSSGKSVSFIKNNGEIMQITYHYLIGSGIFKNVTNNIKLNILLNKNELFNYKK